jgi:hypothetical protein
MENQAENTGGFGGRSAMEFIRRRCRYAMSEELRAKMIKTSMTHLGPDFRAIQPVPFADMVRNDRAQTDVDQARQGRRAFIARTHRRRFACLQAAADALDVLPEEGESLHAVMTGLYDLMHLLIVLLDRFGSPCSTLRIATLSLSRRNVQEMVALFDMGKVRQLDLLTSDFFRKHDDDIFAELVQEFTARGQRVAATRSHCKVVTMALADGRRYVLEGSANLRTNRNLEQFCLSRDPELHQHYDTWLSGMMSGHEIKQNHGAATG